MNVVQFLISLSHFLATMDQKIPYDDYQLPVVFLPSYENPPAWIPAQEVKAIYQHNHNLCDMDIYIYTPWSVDVALSLASLF